MDTSITSEQARARRERFGDANDSPFHTLSCDSKSAMQDAEYAAALAEIDRMGDPEIGTADFERLERTQCHQCGRKWVTEEDADEDAEMWACVSPIGLFDHHGFGDPDPGTVEYDMPITTVALFLYVSEAYVLKALDDAAMPSHEVDGEKRIRLRDVWAIKQRLDADSEAALG